MTVKKFVVPLVNVSEKLAKYSMIKLFLRPILALIQSKLNDNTLQIVKLYNFITFWPPIYVYFGIKC
jgi:hypothetical protein